MSEKRSIVFEALEALGVPYEVWEHPAVYTIEDLKAELLALKGGHAAC